MSRKNICGHEGCKRWITSRRFDLGFLNCSVHERQETCMRVIHESELYREFFVWKKLSVFDYEGQLKSITKIHTLCKSIKRGLSNKIAEEK